MLRPVIGLASTVPKQFPGGGIVPKIIVGIDESDRSKDAVVLASQLARGSHAELILVCAYPYGDSPSRVENPEYMGFVKAGFESVALKLRPGNNEIVLAVTDDQRFGWGFVARLKELR